jgi:hypothetical protein
LSCAGMVVSCCIRIPTMARPVKPMPYTLIIFYILLYSLSKQANIMPE